MISKAPTAGIYFSHYECFGHTSRIMAVGEVFKKRFPKGNLFFIQAGLAQPRAQIGRLGRLYSLPGAFMDRRNFKEPVKSAGADFEKRSQVCVDIISGEKPDLLMTEFFPLGREECRHELIAPLVKALKQGARLWGIAGYPLLTGTDPQWREKILKLYEKIIVFSPAKEKEMIAGRMTRSDERKRYLDFFEKNASKIIFAGYLLPQREVVNEDEDENYFKLSVPKNACRVAVVRGGGAYYPKMIAEAIRASDLLGKKYHMTIVTGPATTAREWYFFVTLAQKKKINNLILRRSASRYEALLAASDVSVSTAAYHTSVMLLKHRKKSVVIPLEGQGGMSFYEQPARAELLKGTIGARVLPFGDLTAAALAARIEDAAGLKKVPASPKSWFTGASVLSTALKDMK